MSLRLHRGDVLVGGALARNPAHPSMDGRTFFGERRSGRIWALARSGEGAWEGRMLLDTTLRIGAIGAAEDGSLFVADERSGRILELRDASPAPRH